MLRFTLFLTVIKGSFGVLYPDAGECIDLAALATDPTRAILAPYATACENDVPEALCEYWYPAPPVVAGQTVDRLQCFNSKKQDGSWTNNTGVYKGAIKSCAKRCGYCCLTSDYTCENWKAPPTSSYTPEITQICAAVTEQSCATSIANRPIYAKFCPQKCGFCNLNGCVDALPSCKNAKEICDMPDMAAFASQYCKRTCGLCECPPDTRPDCELYKDLYCDPNNGKSVMREFCATTCKIC